MRPAPVLMIALDSAEPRLIERWMNDGTLPNLKRLHASGRYGRLASTADWLAGSPWPTFYTGKTPADHGLYHCLQWRADKMQHVEVSPDWLPLNPFWRDLAIMGHRVVAVDVPMTFPPEPFKGVEIYGWATHDQLGRNRAPTSNPPSVIDWAERELGLGASPLGEEVWGIQQLRSLCQLRDQLLRATRSVATLAEGLMRHEKWDLFMVCFAATHRGGHRLWDHSGLWGGGNSEEISQALREIYIACDSAVGQLVKVADESATIIVFSLHGMGPNTDRSSLLPKMLAQILGEETKSSVRVLRRLKEYIPCESRYNVSNNPLTALLHKPYKFWCKQHESSNLLNVTPAFNLITDLHGYIRVNLQGREASGIIEPGQDYDQLCSTITEGLRTYVDSHTGESIVENVMRSDHLFKKGHRIQDLPDLIVRWSSKPAANHKTIVSDRYGSIQWFTPGRNPTGRSGNHCSEGFLLAYGDDIQPDSQIEGAHILDLAPTIFALLNAPKPTGMCGKVIPGIQSR